MLAETANTSKMLSLFGLELLALIGETLGVTEQAFASIFEQKPWLFAARQNKDVEQTQA
jgi:hypothetical protein